MINLPELFLFDNDFPEVYFIYHKVHSFQVHNPMIFSNLTVWWSHGPQTVLKYCHHPSEIPHAPLRLILSPTLSLHFVCANLPYVDILHNWNHTWQNSRVWPFHWASCVWGPSFVQHVRVVCSFLLLNSISLYEYSCQNNCEVTDRVCSKSQHFLNCKDERLSSKWH